VILEILCDHIPKPLNKGIWSVFGRFIEDYLRNLTCWEKSKNRFGFSAPKLSKNRFSKDKNLFIICWVVLFKIDEGIRY
jgi:hypothetical protein